MIPVLKFIIVLPLTFHSYIFCSLLSVIVERYAYMETCASDLAGRMSYLSFK